MMKQQCSEGDVILNTIRQLHLPPLTIKLPALAARAAVQAAAHTDVTQIIFAPQSYAKSFKLFYNYVNELPEKLKRELKELFLPLCVYLYHDIITRQSEQSALEYIAQLQDLFFSSDLNDALKEQSLYLDNRYVLHLSELSYTHLVTFVSDQSWLFMFNILNKNFQIDVVFDTQLKGDEKSKETSVSDLTRASNVVELGMGMLPFLRSYNITAPPHINITNMSFSKDNTKLVASCSNSKIYKWDLDSDKVAKGKDHVPLCFDSQFNFEKEDEEDGDDKKLPYSVLSGHTGPVYSVDWSSTGSHLLSSAYDAGIRLWDAEKCVSVAKYDGHTKWPVFCVKFSPVEPFFASASHDGTARLWCSDRVEPLRILAGHDDSVTCLSFHPNGNYLVTGSEDLCCRMWDVTSGRCVRVLTKHKSPITSVSVSPNGKQALSTARNGSIVLWDLASGRSIKDYINPAPAPLTNGTAAKHRAPCQPVLHHSVYVNQNSVLTGDSANQVILWDTRTHSKLLAHPISTTKAPGVVQTLSNSLSGLVAVGCSIANH